MDTRRFLHGKMGSKKGTYSLTRTEIDDDWLNSEYPFHEGRQELPQHYSQLRMDFDWQSDDGVCRPLYNMEDFILSFNFITDWLSDHLKYQGKKLPKKHTKAVFLTKEPYIKNNKVKHGLHIQFPYIFLSKDDFRIFESEMIPHFPAMDSIVGKPWLMYGQSKGKEYKPYEYAFTLYNGNKYTDFRKAFSDYKVYNKDEEEVELTLKRMLSIQSFGRLLDQEVYGIESKQTKSFQKAKIDIRQEYNDEETEQMCRSLVPMLNSSRADDRNDWMSVGWCLYSLLSGSETGLELWKDFSQGCMEKYDEESCEYEWYRMNVGNYSIGTLRKWAKEDSPESYTEWSKTVVKNKIKKKTRKVDEEDLDTSSEWFDTPYRTAKGDQNKTYGEMCLEDPYYVDWIMDNNIIPHARRFAEIRMVDNYNSFPSIKADEVIDANDIGSYGPRFEKDEIVAVRSNMMTYKTVNMVNYIKENPSMRVLHITFRISLAKKHWTDLRELNFMLYSDSARGIIKDDRVVVQLDSLTRVRGKYDLIILDEIEAIKEHMFARTIKDKKKIWDCLTQHLSCSGSKILISDALLMNETVEWIEKMSGKKSWVVENKYQSFKDQRCIILPTLSSSEMAIRIIDYMKDGEKIFFPCNNKGYLQRLSYLVQKECQDKIIGVACQENRIAEEDWGKYDFLGITPTYVAGNSFSEKHFTRCIGFFQNNTCTAEMSSQMIRRVRHTEKEMEICLSNPIHYHLPTSYKSIDKWLVDKDEIALEYGFNIDYTNNKITKDLYYEQVILNNLKKNKSYMGFGDIFTDILKLHGVVVVDNSKEDVVKVDVQKVKEYDDETNIKIKADRNMERILVSKAKDITWREAERLSMSKNITQEEKYMLRKYWMKSTYNVDIITPKMVEHLEKKQGSFRRYCKMTNPFWDVWVKDNIEMLENDKIKSDNTERLHSANDGLVCYAMNEMLKGIGFDMGIKSEKRMRCFPYERAIEYLNRKEGDIALILGKKNKVQEWNVDMLDDDKYRRKVSLRVNEYLKQVGIGVKRVNNKFDDVFLKPEPWTDYGIQIKENIWMDTERSKVEVLLDAQGPPL